MSQIFMMMACLVLGLLAGYQLGNSFTHNTTISNRLSLRFNSSPQRRTGSSLNYSVFGSWWSTSQWSRDCNTPGGKHLCELPAIWQNCEHGIYLDIGTNLGVQLRKLYNPEQFKDAPVLPLFDSIFGMNRSRVCSIGIEANPHHTEYLETINSYFERKQYPGVVITEMAASVHPGTATFHLDTQSPVQWGASLTRGGWQNNGNDTTTQVTVHLLPLPTFLIEVVRPIVLQTKEATGMLPPIVMKLDVEGAEYSLLPGLLLTGALCDLNLLFLEVHALAMQGDEGVNMTIAEMQHTFDKMRKAHPQCLVRISHLDDESYVHGDKIPLPL